MTPQEKAQELTLKFTDLYKSTHTMAGDTNEYRERNYTNWGKQFALVAVDEILSTLPEIYDYNLDAVNFWQSVKTEILQ